MSDQPAPLGKEQLERIRSLHVEWKAKDGQGNPNGPTCSMCLNRWPCPMLSVLTTLDAERTLRQAAETALATSETHARAMERGYDQKTEKLEFWSGKFYQMREMAEVSNQRANNADKALAEMTERAERAESVLADQAQQMREDVTRRQAVERRLAEERQARERERAIRTDLEHLAGVWSTSARTLADERDQARAALAACEARQARETLPSTAEVASVRTDHALFRDTDDETGEPIAYCEMDGEGYPCKTIRSLNALAACEARLAEAQAELALHRFPTSPDEPFSPLAVGVSEVADGTFWYASRATATGDSPTSPWEQIAEMAARHIAGWRREQAQPAARAEEGE